MQREEGLGQRDPRPLPELGSARRRRLGLAGLEGRRAERVEQEHDGQAEGAHRRQKLMVPCAAALAGREVAPPALFRAAVPDGVWNLPALAASSSALYRPWRSSQ